MARIPAFYRKLEELRVRYYEASSGKEDLLKMISQAEVSEHVYNSNAIENSTLSLEETERILLEIDLERFISQRELFEAKNLARVVEYISNKAKDSELTLEMILLLHKMLLSNIRDEVAGRFRNENEFVKVANHIAPNPKEVTTRLKNMLSEYHSNPSEHVVKKIAKQHLTFEYIHPFVDGNGRIGRVLNNYLLLRDGYVPINIKYVNREQYYSAFREFDLDKKTTIMETIVGHALTNSYHKRLAYLESKKIVDLREYSKIKKLSHSNLINKAQRQTIEAFTENGIWKIGV